MSGSGREVGMNEWDVAVVGLALLVSGGRGGSERRLSHKRLAGCGRRSLDGWGRGSEGGVLRLRAFCGRSFGRRPWLEG